jgi:hypothetical protein
MTTAATPTTAPACPEHGPMLRREGRAGPFFGCREFPRCTYTAPVGLPGIVCPKCSAPIVERRAKKTGRVFWPCSSRTCDVIAWERPHTCSACGAGCFGAERPRRDAAAGPDPAGPDRDADIVPF